MAGKYDRRRRTSIALRKCHLVALTREKAPARTRKLDVCLVYLEIPAIA